MSGSHQHVEDLIAAFARGDIVVVTDDDDRENEGDLFVAASLCTPEKMAFIIRNTSGIVCAPLSGEDAKRLHLRRLRFGQRAKRNLDILQAPGDDFSIGIHPKSLHEIAAGAHHLIRLVQRE